MNLLGHPYLTSSNKSVTSRVRLHFVLSLHTCTHSPAQYNTMRSRSTKRCIYRGRGISRVKGSVCFVLKFALQRGVGEKREGVQISKQSTQNLRHHKCLAPCTAHRKMDSRQYCAFAFAAASILSIVSSHPSVELFSFPPRSRRRR